MKRILSSLVVLAFTCILTACSSAEADELLEYHNDLVDYVNPRMDELLTWNDEVLNMQSEAEALELQKSEIIPVLNEIQEYINTKNPKYGMTIEYHELVRSWINALSEGVHLETEAFEGLLDETLTEDEALELISLSEEAVQKSLQFDEEAYEKWEEIKAEYNFEDVEE